MMILPRLTYPWTILFGSLGLMMLFFTWPELVQAGCQINVYAKNTGKARLGISNTTNFTGVKSKGGLWKALHKGLWFSGNDRIWIDPEKTKGARFFADFRCGAKRRYRISYRCESGANKGRDFSDYYPSPTGWTTNQTVTIPLRQCK